MKREQGRVFTLTLECVWQFLPLGYLRKELLSLAGIKVLWGSGENATVITDIGVSTSEAQVVCGIMCAGKKRGLHQKLFLGREIMGWDGLLR
ncbi:hypothetical protein CDAR_475681 [Caerostris darwini]|uniref:Ribosomal protein L5 n=1 Tax=Caerostris darwini TaxID=1538125 RepID=A0AAV4PBM3_9ARAC|nr:hypothetical protein CDAR_475681 [Caerostris darwini]